MVLFDSCTVSLLKNIPLCIQFLKKITAQLKYNDSYVGC